MATEHIILYYNLRTEVYTEATLWGVGVGHIAEWALEQWWREFANARRVEVEWVMELSGQH